jgi:predicted CopG family antitoxin
LNMFNYVFKQESFVKTLTIRDEVYQKLLSLKRSSESFSDLFERLADGVDPLEVVRHLRGSVDLPERETILTEIQLKRAERRE